LPGTIYFDIYISSDPKTGLKISGRYSIYRLYLGRV